MPLEHALQFRGTFPDPGPWKAPIAKPTELSSVLGLDSLPQQLHQRAHRNAFRFNVMVVGESGLGKSTFINTLFHTDLCEAGIRSLDETGPKTVEIKPIDFELEEDGVTLKLRLIDTPGFGDHVDRSKDLESIIQYIDEQYQDYYDADSDISSRKDIQDNRVHLCFYFIPPTIRGLKELDIVTMKALSSRVNLIPLVSKADTLLLDEKRILKEIILEDIEKFDIKVFPNAYEDHQVIPEIEKAIPFAIVGSEDRYQVNGKMVRAREYPWGYVDVEDPAHSDFIHVRELIMCQCLEELVSLTHTEHYHNMRMGKLKSKLPKSRPESFMLCDENYDETIEDMQTKLVNDMNEKEEHLRQDFVNQVKTAEATLKEKEYMLEKKRDQLNMELETKQKAIEETERAIQELRQRFENINMSQRS